MPEGWNHEISTPIEDIFTPFFGAGISKNKDLRSKRRFTGR